MLRHNSINSIKNISGPDLESGEVEVIKANEIDKNIVFLKIEYKDNEKERREENGRGKVDF